MRPDRYARSEHTPGLKSKAEEYTLRRCPNGACLHEPFLPSRCVGFPLSCTPCTAQWNTRVCQISELHQKLAARRTQYGAAVELRPPNAANDSATQQTEGNAMWARAQATKEAANRPSALQRILRIP